jgi:hypothetical protein
MNEKIGDVENALCVEKIKMLKNKNAVEIIFFILLKLFCLNFRVFSLIKQIKLSLKSIFSLFENDIFLSVLALKISAFVLKYMDKIKTKRNATFF